jgi:hypothetical protein
MIDKSLVYSSAAGGPFKRPPSAPPQNRLGTLPILYFDRNGQPVYGGITDPPPQTDRPVGLFPPPVSGPPVGINPPQTDRPVGLFPPPVFGPPVGINPPPVFGPPVFGGPSAADTRAAGYNATMQRFANSPFARPEGIMGLQRNNKRLS